VELVGEFFVMVYSLIESVQDQVSPGVLRELKVKAREEYEGSVHVCFLREVVLK